MKKIELTGRHGAGRFAIVDDDMYAELNATSWTVLQDGYAVHIREYMHRRITNAPPGKTVDHINGNRLDNRRANLRICSSSQNSQNSKTFSTNTSGLRGVSAHGSGWVARIWSEGRYHYLGWFSDIGDAYGAYLTASLELHGEYSGLNRVDQ